MNHVKNIQLCVGPACSTVTESASSQEERFVVIDCANPSPEPAGHPIICARP